MSKFRANLCELQLKEPTTNLSKSSYEGIWRGDYMPETQRQHDSLLSFFRSAALQLLGFQ